MRTPLYSLLFLVFAIDGLHAQLPVQLSVNAGLAVPIRNDRVTHESGFHVGAAATITTIPLQLEGSLDRLGAKVGDDLTVLSGALTIRINVTPPLSPLSLYVLGGGGLYSMRAETTVTDPGITGGAGLRLGGPFLNPFVELRGVGIFREGNKLTYVTATVGVRF